jgi:hypothetical protein
MKHVANSGLHVKITLRGDLSSPLSPTISRWNLGFHMVPHIIVIIIPLSCGTNYIITHRPEIKASWDSSPNQFSIIAEFVGVRSG